MNLYDTNLWVSIILGLIFGWTYLILLQNGDKLLQKTSLKKHYLWVIPNQIMHLSMVLISSLLVVFIPFSILQRGISYPKKYYGIYLIAFIVGALLRLSKFRAYITKSSATGDNKIDV